MTAKLDELRIDRSEEPQRSSTRLISIAIAVALIAGLVLWLMTRPQATRVRTAAAVAAPSGAAQTVLNASGYVTARRQATVSSKITGKVVEVLIEEGMEVSEGQVLARLDTSNVSAALRLSEAQLAAARADLEETRVRVEEARLERDRVEQLAAEQVASPRDLDRAVAEFDAVVARLAAQREAVTVAERAVALRRQDLEDLVIRAPFDGMVVDKSAQPGEMISPVSAGGGFTRTGIGTVVDMDSLEIEVDVNEAYIQRVEAGQAVTATLDAYPGTPVAAHVIAIVPTADRQKATVKVRIGFDEPGDPRILPDMGVKVAFRGDEDTTASSSGAIVPKSALRRDGDADIVFVVVGERAERRAVRVASTTSEQAVIAAGVNAGERVVVQGPPELADRETVQEDGPQQEPNG